MSIDENAKAKAAIVWSVKAHDAIKTGKVLTADEELDIIIEAYEAAKEQLGERGAENPTGAHELGAARTDQPVGLPSVLQTLEGAIITKREHQAINGMLSYTIAIEMPQAQYEKFYEAAFFSTHVRESSPPNELSEIESVARALCANNPAFAKCENFSADNEIYHSDKEWHYFWEEFIPQAKAAIAAARPKRESGVRMGFAVTQRVSYEGQDGIITLAESELESRQRQESFHRIQRGTAIRPDWYVEFDNGNKLWLNETEITHIEDGQP